MPNHTEIDRIHDLGLLIRIVVGTVDLRLLNNWRSETWDVLLERMIALSELSNHHAVIHSHAVVPLNLVDNLLFEESDIF